MACESAYFYSAGAWGVSRIYEIKYYGLTAKGKVDIIDGNFTGGSGSSSYAVNVSGKADVEISGGSFDTGAKGKYTVYQGSSQSSITISGGSFSSGTDSVIREATLYQDKSIEVSGGTFDKPVTKYVSEGITAIGYTGKDATTSVYAVGEDAAKVAEKAEEGATVTVLKGDKLTVADKVTVKNETEGTIEVNGTTVSTDDEIVAHLHDAVKVEAKAATATESGNIQYWYCEGCDTYFADEELTKVIDKESTVVPPTGTKPDGNQGADGNRKPDASAKTGDGSDMTPWLALSALSLVAMAGVCLKQRKKNAR
ncbi:MAG: hypothetical protein UIJ87_04555 [Anaerovoracaceae bacterium]|nr:hypothetical protein [Anaerovoracaceae bacterium]